jgi:hypothetical protein
MKGKCPTRFAALGLPARLSYLLRSDTPTLRSRLPLGRIVQEPRWINDSIRAVRDSLLPLCPGRNPAQPLRPLSVVRQDQLKPPSPTRGWGNGQTGAPGRDMGQRRRKHGVGCRGTKKSSATSDRVECRLEPKPRRDSAVPPLDALAVNLFGRGSYRRGGQGTLGTPG